MHFHVPKTKMLHFILKIKTFHLGGPSDVKNAQMLVKLALNHLFWAYFTLF